MSRPRSILTAVDDFRQRLAAREAATAAAFTEAFEGIAAELTSLIDDIAARIERARDLGLDTSPSWAFQEARVRELLRQTEALIVEYAPTATARIITDQRFAADLAGTQARQLTLFQLPPTIAVSFTRLPQEALTDLLGVLADGSPLRSLLDDLGPYASRRMRDELVTGLATGRNPREVARRLRDVPGLTAKRAQLISRDSMLRSYRTSSLRTYQANSDVLIGWKQLAALDERTCASCIALHGVLRPLTEEFAPHSGDRCATVPVTRFAPAIETGEEWFGRQSADMRRRMLGPAKYNAMEAGEIGIQDLTEFRRDPKWGPLRHEPSLRQILGRREAESFYQQAADDD